MTEAIEFLVSVFKSPFENEINFNKILSGPFEESALSNILMILANDNQHFGTIPLEEIKKWALNPNGIYLSFDNTKLHKSSQSFIKRSSR
jgi:hypothetical protein